MAITVKSAPSGTPSAHENLWHVADSTNKAASDFQYVWDIYKGGVLQARLKTRPEGTNSYGKLDAAIVVRSLLADSIPPSMNYAAFGSFAALGTDVLFVNYTMAVGESITGTISGNLVSGGYTAYNSIDANLSTVSGSVMSNRPLQSSAVSGEPLVFTFLPSGTQTFNVTGASTFSHTASGSFAASFPVTTNETIVVSGVGTYKFKLLCRNKYTPRTLMFLNRYGGWDSYTFALKSQRSIEATRKMNEQNDWHLVGDNMVNTSNAYVQREARRVYATEYRTLMELNAYQTTTEEYIWLEELITSPAVYLWQGNIWTPVMITETNYRPINVLLDKGETIKLNIEFSSKNITQYR